MKSQLTLTKNGNLYRNTWNSKKQEYKTKNVTKYAYRYLFETCELNPDCTLRSVFLMLNKHNNLDIFDSILGNWTREYVLRGLGTSASYRKTYEDESLDYLELHWSISEWDKELEGSTFPDLNATGTILKDQDFGKAGTQIPLSIIYTPVSELVNLPLKLNFEYAIFKNTEDTPIYYTSKAPFTLGQILHGIMYELSYLGAPCDRASARAETLKLLDELKSRDYTDFVSIEEAEQEVKDLMKKDQDNE